VVFDGQNLGFTDRGGQPGIRVIFTEGEKADRKIKEIADRLAGDHRKREWLVVTSDFDICYRVQGLGLKTESSRDFAYRLKADESKIDKKSRAKQNQFDPHSREKELSPKDREWIYSVFMEKKSKNPEGLRSIS
jgi:predicted RNA-binding protein with PIN domain